MVDPAQLASVRYLVDDVDAAVAFYTTELGFTIEMSAGSAFADVRRGALRLLLSGAVSSGAKATPTDLANTPGRNRIHLIVDDVESEVARLRDAGVTFVSDMVSGPGGSQFLISDPSGNLVEIFEPASR
jgi:catechol 2,3-dioxygenase-like lactoylglutathione lyase family enzyme